MLNARKGAPQKFYVSLAHDSEDITKTINAFSKAVEALT